MRKGWEVASAGTTRNDKAGAIQQAMLEISEEASGDVTVTASRQRKPVLERAGDLAQAVPDALIRGNLMNQVSEVGERIMVSEAV